MDRVIPCQFTLLVLRGGFLAKKGKKEEKTEDYVVLPQCIIIVMEALVIQSGLSDV